MEPVVRSMSSVVLKMRPRRMTRTFMMMWMPTEMRKALAQRTRARVKTSLRIWRSKSALSLFENFDLNHVYFCGINSTFYIETIKRSPNSIATRQMAWMMKGIMRSLTTSNEGRSRGTWIRMRGCASREVGERVPSWMIMSTVKMRRLPDRCAWIA